MGALLSSPVMKLCLRYTTLSRFSNHGHMFSDRSNRWLDLILAILFRIQPDVISKALCENRLLRDIQANVEDLFVNGRPLHHLDSARKIEFNHSDPHQSSVFIVEYHDFVKMSTETLQLIFKHRHILVLNTPSERPTFSLNSLCKLGSIDTVRRIHGELIPSYVGVK
jgi:hypothetical protein